MQASLLRSACFPLINHDNNWKERLDEEMKLYGKNFEEITEIIKNKIEIGEKNIVSNAYQALPLFLDKHWNEYNDNDLMIHTKSYLNENFRNDWNYERFNLLVVASTNVSYHSPDLFYYSKSDNRSVVVGLGKVSVEENCDEDNYSGINKLTCFKIGDFHVNYYGEPKRRVSSDFPYYPKFSQISRGLSEEKSC